MKNIGKHDIIIKETDESVLKVFTRADEMMYMAKTEMKKELGIERGSGHRAE